MEVPKDYYMYHSRTCGRLYRDCAPDCPKNLYERTGDPSFIFNCQGYKADQIAELERTVVETAVIRREMEHEMIIDMFYDLVEAHHAAVDALIEARKKV